MKKKLLLLPLLTTLLFACEPSEPLTVARERGQILAGQTGPGIVSDSYESPVAVRGGAFQDDVFELTPGHTERQILFVATEYSGSSSGVSYSHATSLARSSDLLVEFSIDAGMWLCGGWSGDSTQWDLYYYTNPTATGCPYSNMDVVDTFKVPTRHAANTRIDSTLNWYSGDVDLAFRHHNQYTQYDSTGAPTTVIQNSQGEFWLGLGRQYLGFRWYGSDGTWHYGWVLLEVSSTSTIRLYGYGVEE